MRVTDRVLKKQTPDENGCLVSWYSVGSHGYAQVGWHTEGVRTMTLCHLVVWTAANGPVPEGLTVDHTCRNKKCVNIAHMRLLSNFENARRTNGHDWPLGQCINGHPNSELRKRQRWVCSLCYLEKARRHRAKRQATTAV